MGAISISRSDSTYCDRFPVPLTDSIDRLRLQICHLGTSEQVLLDPCWNHKETFRHLCATMPCICSHWHGRCPSMKPNDSIQEALAVAQSNGCCSPHTIALCKAHSIGALTTQHSSLPYRAYTPTPLHRTRFLRKTVSANTQDLGEHAPQLDLLRPLRRRALWTRGPVYPHAPHPHCGRRNKY